MTPNSETDNQGEENEGVSEYDESSSRKEGRNEKIARSEEEFYAYLASKKTKAPFHPTQASSFQLRKLVMTSKLPERENLLKCFKEIDSNVKELNQESEFLRVIDALRTRVQRDLAFYHWCFYYSMNEVDIKLEQDNFNYLDEKVNYFYGSMKTLWVLVQSLQQVSNSEIYFRFLRVRYMQMSKDYLARSLVVTAEPFGKPIDSKFPKGRGKPASMYRE